MQQPSTMVMRSIPKCIEIVPAIVVKAHHLAVQDGG
jgi:hypothetical protein